MYVVHVSSEIVEHPDTGIALSPYYGPFESRESAEQFAEPLLERATIQIIPLFNPDIIVSKSQPVYSD